MYVIDLETEEIVGEGDDLPAAPEVPVSLPRVIATAASVSTVVAVLDLRPPLAISHDTGQTWHEAGGGLPRGVAVAIDHENPDRILYAARNRLYLSEDGGRFWRALAPELPEIQAVALTS